MNKLKLKDVPESIGHKYCPIKILDLNDLHTRYKDHRRLKVFHAKGCKCVKCGKEGVYLIAAASLRNGTIHIDLYTKDFELMTIDHIVPKSKGGSNDLYNLQPMCAKCNTKKG